MKSFLYKFVAVLGLAVGPFGWMNPSAAQAKEPVATEIVSRVEEMRDARRPATGRVVTLEEVHKVFRQMASQKDIAYGFVKDGCYARAHLMIQRMQRMGHQPVRVWTFANGESLHVKTRRLPEGFVEWWYHVAPAIPINIKGKTLYLVIDPSMFNRPVTVEEWSNAQRKTTLSPRPMVQITRQGEPVYNPRARTKMGTGYWPDNDPPEGSINHALTTMRRYKALERG